MSPVSSHLTARGQAKPHAQSARRTDAAALTVLGNSSQFAALVGRHLVQSRHYGTRHAVILVALEWSAPPEPPEPPQLAPPAQLKLMELAGVRLRARVRDSDIVVQLGEQRFGVLLVDAARADLQAVQARLQLALGGHYSIGERRLLVTPRLGAAMYPLSGSTGPELVQAAECELVRGPESLGRPLHS